MSSQHSPSAVHTPPVSLVVNQNTGGQTELAECWVPIVTIPRCGTLPVQIKANRTKVCVRPPHIRDSNMSLPSVDFVPVSSIQGGRSLYGGADEAQYPNFSNVSAFLRALDNKNGVSQKMKDLFLGDDGMTNKRWKAKLSFSVIAIVILVAALILFGMVMTASSPNAKILGMDPSVVDGLVIVGLVFFFMSPFSFRLTGRLLNPVSTNLPSFWANNEGLPCMLSYLVHAGVISAFVFPLLARHAKTA